MTEIWLKDTSDMAHGAPQKNISAIYKGSSLYWFSYGVTTINVTTTMSIPRFVNSIDLLMVGGGGGGQSGDGALNSWGRPGSSGRYETRTMKDIDALRRELNTRDLNLRVVIGRGGEGGSSNNDHSAGQVGGPSQAYITRPNNTVDRHRYVQNSNIGYGVGGPASGLSQGSRAPITPDAGIMVRGKQHNAKGGSPPGDIKDQWSEAYRSSNSDARDAGAGGHPGSGGYFGNRQGGGRACNGRVLLVFKGSA